MLSITLSSILLSVPAVLAVTEVIAKPLPVGCASYPRYNEETGTAGPWTIKVSDSENPAIEGFGDTSAYSVLFNGRPSLRWGSITIPTYNQIAKNPFQCINNTMTAWVPNDLTAAGAPTNYQWTPLVISNYPYDAELMWKIQSSEELKPFEHYVDGVKQDGVFIGGYENSTKWGFRYYPANVGSVRDYYLIRLLGPNSADPVTGAALQANETVGYIKIDG
ncbi:hypothetical protein GQ43DRAFT_442491 [Delitschia confertaspora ATCC 74209]|uniref:Uncharacterized protein n=1 Tax=Delitschia confertaspora ATCC 74209 TaxID=1513339 RepID=A0A9P4JMZ3_9PLEO|nr:hypothetical protein GQ43DRAFT_442491 [Delitschia confertaspora ATCC 74209]